MNLYSLRLAPRSPWATPWQSDTLWGLLCWICARTEGDDAVRRDLIEPALHGQPPFLLSDALPVGCFPAPALLRTAAAYRHYRLRHADDPRFAAQRVRKARFITAQGLQAMQRGEWPALEDYPAEAPTRTLYHTHNQIGRTSNTTSAGGRLFFQETWQTTGAAALTVFVRTTEPFVPRLEQLFVELSRVGFGADVSHGKGEFECLAPLAACPEHDNVAGAEASVALSTFQPAAGDPRGLAWEVFVKYGKLGPDWGLQNVFKRPVVLLRPGAVLSRPATQAGRAIPMSQLLATEVVDELRRRGAMVIHPAFGLLLPIRLPSGVLAAHA